MIRAYEHLQEEWDKPVQITHLYLGDIIEKAREIMFHRVGDQVADKMREIKLNATFQLAEMEQELKKIRGLDMGRGM